MAGDLKKLYDFLKISNTFEEEGYKRLFFNNEAVLMIKIEKLQENYSFLDTLYNEFFLGKLTKTSFFSNLIKFMKEGKDSKSELKKIIDDLKDIKVYKQIFGVYTENKVCFKNCTIYNLKENYNDLLKNNTDETFKNFLSQNKDAKFILEINVKGYQSEAAIELANIKIQNLINFFYFMIFGQANLKLINISTNEDLYFGDEFAISSGGGYAYKFGGYKNKILFDLDKLDIAIKNNIEGECLLDIILKENEDQNEFNNIIKSAINWLGESLREENLNMSLLKAVIALEGIFYYQDKLLSPSSLYTICDSSALLLGNDYSEKIDIEKKLKNIYGKRSAISHSGRGEISIYERNYIIMIIKRLIDTFLTSEYSSCKNKQDIMKKVKEIRYRKL